MAHALFRHSFVQASALTIALLSQGLLAEPAWAATDTLLADQSLSNDESLVSKNGKYRAVMQKSDGRFVIYDNANGSSIWAAQGRNLLGLPSIGGPGWVAKLRNDGAFVLIDDKKVIRWASGTKEVKPVQYHLKLEDTGTLNLYKGTPASPVGVIWSSKAGRRYKHVDDVDVARTFRPFLKLSDRTRCYPLTFKEPSHVKDHCRDSYDDKFVVFAHVVRPSAGSVADTDGNSFRIVYGVAFGWQDGTYTGVSQSTLALFTDAGNHGEDAQYLVVDVVNGAVTSVWADLHSGYYTRTRSELSMEDNGLRVLAWVGRYYHPLKLVRESTSICRSEAEGSHGLSSNITHDGLRFLCAGTCGSSRSCMPYDTIINWGDLSGEDHSGGGQLAMVDEVCSSGSSYASPDGVTYTDATGGGLNGMKGYLGCFNGPSHAAAIWRSTFRSKKPYTDAYGLEGCKSGDKSAGDICNASHLGAGTPWLTSRPQNNMYMEPLVAGSADPDYRSGVPFSDLRYINGRPRSLTFRAGARVDAVSITYPDGGIQGHGGTGGKAITMNGLENDPIVRVELCSVTKDGRVRVGHVKFKTYKGVVREGGNGYDNCRTVAPEGKMLYGFYGRSGNEIDLLGTYWGDLPASLPAKPTSW